MGSIHNYNTVHGQRHLVRYRKPDGAHAARRGFLSRTDAVEYLALIDTAIARGMYVDPMTARVTVGELATDWLAFQAAVLKPSTVHGLTSAWRSVRRPSLGSRANRDPAWTSPRLDY